MKAVVAASRHWMDGDAIRKCLVNLPAASTVIVSNRPGGDTLVAKIAEEELALRVEHFDADDDASFRKAMIERINDEVDSAYFFCVENSEVEFFVSKFARTYRIQTQVVVGSYKANLYQS